MKIVLHNIYHQYIIGLILSLLLFALLYSCRQSYSNTQVPRGIYANNIWAGTDINDYLNSGINYVNYGVFGIGDKPDHLRTIGYPAIIAFYYSVFGDNWLGIFQISQCLLFACMYPLMTLLAREVFPQISDRLISVIFLFLLATGTYWVRSIMLLTDTMFALFFTAGFYYGLKVFRSNNLAYVLLYVICISTAAFIRPTLFLFPILNVALAFFVVTKNGVSIFKVLNKLLLTTLIFAFTCNFATLRNFVNYSFLSPSSVVGLNAFRSVAQKIMLPAGEEEAYKTDADKIAATEDISAKTMLREQIMTDAVLRHPWFTAQMLEKNTINIFLDNHMVNNLANYFGYNWKSLANSNSPFVSTYPYKKSLLCLYLTYAMMGLYFVMWVLLLGFCYSAIVKGQYEYLCLIGMLLFIFIFPAVIIGDGGSRLRLPFEPFLVLFALYQAHKIIAKPQQLKHDTEPVAVREVVRAKERVEVLF